MLIFLSFLLYTLTILDPDVGELDAGIADEVLWLSRRRSK